MTTTTLLIIIILVTLLFGIGAIILVQISITAQYKEILTILHSIQKVQKTWKKDDAPILDI